MQLKIFVITGISILLNTGCSTEQPGEKDKTPQVEQQNVPAAREINFDYSIELIGEPVDTTGEVWNVRGIDIYSSETGSLVQRIENLNTLTPVGSDFSGGFMVDDYNFDDETDFRLIKFDRKTSEVEYLFWLYDTKINEFVHYLPLDSLSSPQFDYSNEIIFSEHETDSSLISDSYKFINNDLNLTERRVKTYFEDYIEINRYIMTEGKLQLINSEKTSY